MRDIALRSPDIRLGQLLKLAGVVDSGGEAKELLATGRVLVNGEPDVRRGRTLRDGDVVGVGEEELRVVGGPEAPADAPRRPRGIPRPDGERVPRLD